MISQTDGNGNTTTYEYNCANLMIEKLDPADAGKPASKESYTYYANGLMRTRTDRNGVITAYSYDVFGRMTLEDAGGEVQTYAYDKNGNLTSMSDPTGTTVRTYDGLNRNTRKIVPGIGESVYDYDIVTATEPGTYSEKVTDPKGNVTLKTYDKAGRLSGVTVGEETTTYEYLDNGTLHRVIYPDGTTETYAYDRKNQVTGLINAKQDGTVISSYTYTYDGAGNQLTKTEAKGTTTYTYDSMNRLSSVTEPEGKVTSYTYDGAGNRKTEMIQLGQTGSETVYSYDSRNRLTSTISLGGAYTLYNYDNNGSLISKVSGIKKPLSTVKEQAEVAISEFGLQIKRGYEYGTGTGDVTLYTYDNFNRLTETKSQNNTSTYRYNAQGYRTRKTVNGKITNYLYEGDKVVLETDGSNKQTAFQAYGSNLLYREVSVGEEAGEAEVQSYYYLYNAHGDVTSLIDAEGNIAATYDYDAFGNIINKTGEADNSIRYAGYQYDDESGLYYLNARYYDSVTARFITEDDRKYSNTNDPLSLNLYTYCHNEPIMYIDPSGHRNLIQEYKDMKDKEEAEKKKAAEEKATKEKAAKEKAAKEKAAKEKAAKDKAAKDSNNVYQVSDNGINFIANLEVGKAQLVLDSKGNIIEVNATNSTTMGYGYDIVQDPLGRNIKKATNISQSMALDMLKEATYKDAQAISDPEDITIELNQYQVDALVALRYNIGKLGNVDSLLKDINNGASYDTIKNDIYSYYEDIIKENPSQAKYLDGWLNRVDKILSLYFYGDYSEMPVNAVEGVYNGKK